MSYHTDPCGKKPIPIPNGNYKTWKILCKNQFQTLDYFSFLLQVFNLGDYRRRMESKYRLISMKANYNLFI